MQAGSMLDSVSLNYSLRSTSSPSLKSPVCQWWAKVRVWDEKVYYTQRRTVGVSHRGDFSASGLPNSGERVRKWVRGYRRRGSHCKAFDKINSVLVR